MSLPRDPRRNLSLEQFDDRDGRRPAHLGEVAHVAQQTSAHHTLEFLAAYQALIDAVFTAPGAAEWLSGLRRAVAAMLADKDSTSPAPPVPRDAIRSASSR